MTQTNLRALVKFAIIASPLLCGACNSSSSSTSNTGAAMQRPIAQEDYFQRKMKCSELIGRINGENEKENKESYSVFHHGASKEYDYQSLDEVCYSKKNQTCVVFVSKMIRSKIKNSIQTIKNEYGATDALTNRLLDFTFESYDGNGRVDKNASDGAGPYIQRKRSIHDDADCA